MFLKIFTETAPKHASSLGIFSAAFGLLELAKPSQSDLLRSVNKGFKKLADDVNNRLKKVEGYVDGKVIELEKRLMNREYKTLHRYWVDCVQQSNEKNSIDCMRRGHRSRTSGHVWTLAIAKVRQNAFCGLILIFQRTN